MSTIISNKYLQEIKQCIQLFVISLNTGPDKISIDNKVLIFLLTEYLEKLEDANTLLGKRRYTSANILLRTAYENSIFIDYIFNDESKAVLRSRAYYYSHYQKDLYYYMYIGKTSLMSQSGVRKLFEKAENENFKSFNDYLNKSRTKYKSCFPKLKDNLDFPVLKEKDEPKFEKIDRLVWYNENNRRGTFLLLVSYMQKCIKGELTKYYYINPYFLIYKENSDDVHSQNITSRLRMDKKELKIGQSWNPFSQLVYFYDEGILFINYLMNRLNNKQSEKKLLRKQIIMLKQKLKFEDPENKISIDALINKNKQ